MLTAVLVSAAILHEVCAAKEVVLGLPRGAFEQPVVEASSLDIPYVHSLPDLPLMNTIWSCS
jgi:hypothetical protein